MLGFNKWYNNIFNWRIKYQPNIKSFTKKRQLYNTWRGALKWYQKIADGCEKDCNTDEDYKILYFHLKQVLINELKE